MTRGAASATGPGMKIGIIGSGRIGGTLGGLWVKAGHEVAVPLAADAEAALKIARQLVQDAGFEPVVVGPLARAKEFDTGTAVYGKALTAGELRRGLGIAP